MKNIIIALITVIVPSITTIATTKSVKRQANKHSARQSILQLIMEDRFNVMEGKLPENRQAILDEYDEYSNCGGNSYIHSKVEEYEKWYDKLNHKKKA